MSMTKIYDIAYEIDGDQISLKQDFDCGVVSYITLHRIHLAHLAAETGLLADPAGEKTIRTLCRRLRTLRKEINDLAEWITSAHDEGNEHFPDFLMATALATLANSMMEDLPDQEEPKPNPDVAKTEPTEFSAGNVSALADKERTDRGQLPLIEEELA